MSFEKRSKSSQSDNQYNFGRCTLLGNHPVELVDIGGWAWSKARGSRSFNPSVRCWLVRGDCSQSACARNMSFFEFLCSSDEDIFDSGGYDDDDRWGSLEGVAAEACSR